MFVLYLGVAKSSRKASNPLWALQFIRRAPIVFLTPTYFYQFFLVGGFLELSLLFKKCVYFELPLWMHAAPQYCVYNWWIPFSDETGSQVTPELSFPQPSKEKLGPLSWWCRSEFQGVQKWVSFWGQELSAIGGDVYMFLYAESEFHSHFRKGHFTRS